VVYAWPYTKLEDVYVGYVLMGPTDKSVKREVYGITKRGKRVLLGMIDLDVHKMQEILDVVAYSYQKNTNAYFNVRSTVVNVQSFAGISIKPDAIGDNK
jgi:hypothetical protein